jgi:excisionase family DNA binding protein
VNKSVGAANSHARPLLTISEAAVFLRINPRTVRLYLRRGELKGRLIGGRWRFRQKDLDAFFEEAPSEWEAFGKGRDRE